MHHHELDLFSWPGCNNL